MSRTNSLLRKRILCVEDDKDSSDLLRALFDDHDVTTAKSVRQGLDLARERQFDLYILDSWFPDGDGVELCREIRAFDTGTPIVFFSGISDKPYIARAMKAGANAYLIKVTDMDKLQPTVELLLQGLPPTLA
jgi:DNA-binding response OmpR family regulator